MHHLAPVRQPAPSGRGRPSALTHSARRCSGRVGPRAEWPGDHYRKAEAMRKCVNCGKTVREFGGTWYHYWRVTDPELVTVPAGARECSWRVAPGEVTYATPEGEGS